MVVVVGGVASGFADPGHPHQVSNHPSEQPDCRMCLSYNQGDPPQISLISQKIIWNTQPVGFNYAHSFKIKENQLVRLMFNWNRVLTFTLAFM